MCRSNIAVSMWKFLPHMQGVECLIVKFLSHGKQTYTPMFVCKTMKFILKIFEMDHLNTNLNSH